MARKRVQEVRKSLKLSQPAFGDQLGLSKDMVANIEYGRVELKDHVIKLICSEFNVNEHWLRTGEGEMFSNEQVFSLDVFARQREMSNLELDILKAYFELDPQLRHQLINHFKNKFASPEIVAPESVPLVQAKTDVELAEEAYIKSISSSAKNTNYSASNTTEEIEIQKQAK